jgi:hypothetical protein
MIDLTLVQQFDRINNHRNSTTSGGWTSAQSHPDQCLPVQRRFIEASKKSSQVIFRLREYPSSSTLA